MTKDPSPLLGYNNNIRHNNRVFHVQTEDSGIRHPHIITHLFMDGGRILKSKKTSYAEHLGAEKMADTVRQLMKDQHKGMLIALRDGQFDDLIGDGPKAPPPSPSVQDAVAVARQVAAHAPTIPQMPESRPGPPAVAKAPLVEEAPVTSRNSRPPVQPDVEEDLTLDIDALERAAVELGASNPAFEPQSDLPPPPANLFRAKEGTAGGAYRTLTAKTDEAGPPSRPATRLPSRPPHRTPPPSRVDPAQEKPGTGHPARSDPRAEKSPPPPRSRPAPAHAPAENRYAPARPAAIFGRAKPKQGNSIFGEDLISDKSLDEVILGYLAEDLDAAPEDDKKKK